MSPVFAALLDKVMSFDHGYTWYLDDHANAIINHAATKGWVKRLSTTQVQWTKEGVAAYKQACPMS